jgi:hypothetical protein
MEDDLGALTDDELIARVTSFQRELQRRIDDATESGREPQAVTRLALLGRGVMRGWTGYAALGQEDENTVHIQQPDQEGVILDVWVRWPKGYSVEGIEALKRKLVAALSPDGSQDR